MDNSAKDYLYNMNVSNIITGFVAFSYILASCYLGWRIWISVGSVLHPWAKPFYWLFYGFLVVSYFASDLKDLYNSGAQLFKATTIYSLATTLYLLITVTATDFVLLANRYMHFIPNSISAAPHFKFRVMMIDLIITLSVMIYGAINAHIPAIRHYNIRAQGKLWPIKSLRIAMLSDIHLNSSTRKKDLRKMVSMVNGSNPDIILLAGDTIDQDVRLLNRRNLQRPLKNLSSKFGVFAVFGNHECFGNCCSEIISYLNIAGINVIRDAYVKIADAFYLIGRDDKTLEDITGYKRKSLHDILKDAGEPLPRILVDHQPIGTKEAQENGVDLQLSGHTHAGQLFPLQFITKKIYGISSGYKKIGSLDLVVSSGFGFWGPPFRIGNRPEVVVLDVETG